MGLFFGFKKKKEVPLAGEQPKAAGKQQVKQKKGGASSKAAAVPAAPKPAKGESVAQKAETLFGSSADALIAPRITEKATAVTVDNAYVFDVKKGVSKQEIARAVKERYNVVPIKIRTAAIPRKRIFVRGKWGMTGGGKKALVFLKKGDTIQIS